MTKRREITSRSKAGLFAGLFAANLDGPDDFFDEHSILKQDPVGFAQIDFGRFIKSGTTLETLRNDLVFDVTTVDGSVLGEVRTVPEPTAYAAIAVGLYGLLLARRRAQVR